MHPPHPVPTARTLFVLASISALAACATVRGGRPGEGVTLAKPYQIISSDSLSTDLADKFANLASIDPEHPLAEEDAGQTLSIFGREDLIAATSDDYRSTHCTPLTPADDILDEITRRARQTSIVIISESHQRSEYRGFIADVARRLRPLGYDTLAIETLQNNPPSTPMRYAPTFIKQPDLPYLEDGDGFYLSEAGFGRLGRQAKALGYHLLPYEFSGYDGIPQDATPDQRVAAREEGQASNLAAFIREHPRAKLLIHVGYSHAAEVPQASGEKLMAARLKDKTGIDPLTISQTSCRGGGDTLRLSALPADQPTGSFDLVVDHPGARFVRGRPEWRKLAGDKTVRIPHALRPSSGWRVIEARPAGEPVASVPMDRVAIRPGEDIALMLPAGRYDLRAIDVARTEPAPAGAAR